MSRQSVTIGYLEERIASVDYLRIPNTTVTICSLTMENGYVVLGESACVDPAAFNELKGQTWAYEKALDKLWELEGYLLAEERKFDALQRLPFTVVK